jgi:hypothetical protein
MICEACLTPTTKWDGTKCVASNAICSSPDFKDNGLNECVAVKDPCASSYFNNGQGVCSQSCAANFIDNGLNVCVNGSGSSACFKGFVLLNGKCTLPT